MQCRETSIKYKTKQRSEESLSVTIMEQNTNNTNVTIIKLHGQNENGDIKEEKYKHNLRRDNQTARVGGKNKSQTKQMIPFKLISLQLVICGEKGTNRTNALHAAPV